MTDREPVASSVAVLLEKFHAELRARTLTIFRWSSWVFNVLFVAWAVFDYLLARQHWRMFFAMRAGVAVFGFVVAATVQRVAALRHRSWEAWWLWVFVMGASVAFMLPLVGGQFFPFLMGFTVVMLGGSFMPDWRPVWAGSNALAITATIPIAFALLPSTVAKADLVGGSLFLVTAIGLSVLAAYFKYEPARRAFFARHELALTSAELEQALDKLKELDRMKSDFMANISHEMRTPLTLMLGSLESLGAASASAMAQRELEYLDVIRRNGLGLLRLINDLLDLARLEAAQARLRLEEFDAVELVRGIILQAGPMFSWRSLELESELPDQPVNVTLDRLRIEKVVLNLLSNAIKFTPAMGGIRVVLRALPEHVLIEVHDSGIGIPEEHLERIFERFHQVDASSTRSRGGTGIGLTLVKEFVELHAGTVSVESRPGEGSTFAVTLPRDPSRIPEDRIDRRQARADTSLTRRHDDLGLGAWVATISESAEYRYGELYDVADRRTSARIEVGPRKGTVLVVEDSRDLARFIALQLSHDYNVITAADGEEGWERARGDLPDLVVTDLMMPRRDGLWLCQQLRDDPVTRPIPIIMLTARGQAEDRANARERGADVYISKPFNVRELLAAIQRLMKRREERIDSLTSETSSSMRVLAAGLAHELLNPLGFISNAVFALDELMKDMIRSGETAKLGPTCLELLRSASIGVERVQALVGELKSVAEVDPHSVSEPADLNQSLRSTLVLVGAGSQSAVSFHVDLCEDATVVCRVGRMNQVFLNLVKNALQALPPTGGSVWVKSRRTGDGLEISIADDGEGITPENLARVFDPFFTTRDPGRGTGLGLAHCRRIVEDHGGTLSLSSVVDEGTRAVIRIPTSPAASRG